MSIGIKKLGKRIIKITATVAAAITILLLVLRSVYAISIFNGLSAGMQDSGWTQSGGDSVMQSGEQLTFEASYLFFKIGSVKMQVLGKTVYDGVPAYHVRANIDSYSGIPFVNLHAVYDTYQDARTFMCLFTSNSQKDGKDFLYTAYHFDFGKKIMDWQFSRNGKLVDDVKIPLDKSYTDGLSFFYYLRDACRKANGARTTMSVPIVIDTIRSKIELTINEKEENCDVTAYKYPLKAYKLSGHMNFTGFFGVTGDFKGWVSADRAEVPLKANVSVIIGSVVVSLKDAGRTGWVPPRSSD